MRKSMFVVLLLGAGLVTVTTTRAHHAVEAQFNINKLESFTGTLIKIDWINPHAWFHFEVIGRDGTVEQWATETVGPITLRRFGLDRSMFVVGETYKIDYNPDRSGAHIGLTKAFTFSDGKYVKVFRGFTVFDAARSALDAAQDAPSTSPEKRGGGRP